MTTRVFMFSSVHAWNDVRVFYKEARSLAKRYAVELHIRAPFRERKKEGVRVIGLKKRFRWYHRWVNDLVLLKRAVFSSASVYHFHDPELIPVGLVLKLLGRKVIYDVHEDHATSLLLKEQVPLALRKVLSKLFRAIEKASMKIFDMNIFAEKYYKELYDGRFEHCDIYNYPLGFEFDGKKPADTVNLAYTGTVTKARGVYNMMEMFRHLDEKYKLFIVGKAYEPEVIKALRKFKKEFGNRVEVVGYGNHVDHSQLMNYAMKSHVGLAVFDHHPHYDRKLLTKFYEYMQAGMFLVVSDFPKWKEFVNSNRCGIAVDVKNMKKAAQQIEKKYREMKPRCEYTWKSEEKKLFEVYERLV